MLDVDLGMIGAEAILQSVWQCREAEWSGDAEYLGQRTAKSRQRFVHVERFLLLWER